MRSTVNVGHREPSLPVSDRPHHRCSGGFEKPGALAPAGAPMAHTETTQPAGEWKGSGSPGLGHTAPRVSPLLRCGRPIRQSSFLSLPNIMHPPCCAPPSVHLGLFLGHLLCQGLTAGELVEGPPVPTAPRSLPSHPAAAGPSLQRLTGPATFLPLCTGPQA